MHCFNCGAPLRDGAAFCPGCGARQMASPTPYPIPPKPKKKWVLPVVIAAAALLVGVVVLLFTMGDKSDGEDTAGDKSDGRDTAGATSEEGAIESYYDAIERCSASALLKCVPDKALKEIKDDHNLSNSELEEAVQDYMDDFFDDVDSVDVDIKDKDKFSSGELEELNDHLDNYNIKASAAYECELYGRAEIDGDIDSQNYTSYVYKVGGSWYYAEALDDVVSAVEYYYYY